MLTIGLTGGIASGKSTVTRLFAERGIAAVDADQIAREVVEPGEPMLDALVERYGERILDRQGRLNRAALRQRIFASPEERRWVESRMHPLIHARMLERLETLEGPYRLLVVPLLLESDRYAEVVDRILVVDVPEALQLQRVLARDGGELAQAEAIVRAQMPRAERLARSDEMIDNSRDELSTERRVAELDAFYRRLAHQRTACGS
ncbi:dephospho-CoA kinase [Halotalea alkalilenta]|uniref:dephospho-CoA kinase n=1 Tax=Halotalea alkalilenta TaxID=376489 RepID=UPI000480E194|nr:dephospho-CoA kinase [Halotalea alkalilenta]